MAGNYTATTKTEAARPAGLFDGDPATPEDLARLEAMIRDEEERADADDAEIKRLETEHGIDSLKESRKLHKEAAADLISKLRAAVKAGGGE